MTPSVNNSTASAPAAKRPVNSRLQRTLEITRCAALHARKSLRKLSRQEHDQEVNRGRFLLVVAILSGALCLATGLSYLTVSPTELTISALVTLGVLGCCTLVAAGVWQAWVNVRNRRLPLVVLGVVGFGFSAASAFGLAGAQIARGARLEPTGLPSALHAVDFMMGIILCVLSLAELLRIPTEG